MASAQSGVNGFQSMFSFGDSYTTVGFNVAGLQPGPSNFIGNPALPGKTTAGGYNWVDWLMATQNESLCLAYDFAIAGATVDSVLVPPYTNSVKSFVDQVGQFAYYYGSGGIYNPVWQTETSLFTTWFGINDILRGYSESSWTTLSSEISDQYFDQIEILYNTGARYLLVFMVPPIQQAPSIVVNATTSQDTEYAVNGFNDEIISRLPAAMQSFPEMKIWLLNTTSIFETALNDPTAYGAKDAVCYSSDGTSCLWYNDLHPARAIHKLIAEGIKAVVAT